MNLITREYLGNKIEFKLIGGEVYANANSMASGFGGSTKIADWKRSANTKRYLEAMEKSHRVENLVISKDGVEAGTWIHEKLVLHFARYCDVGFEIWCDDQIATLLREGKVEIIPPIQPIRRAKPLAEMTNMDIMKENAIALSDVFDILNINIPKDLVLTMAINQTEQETGADFSGIKQIVNKQDDEQYHSPTGILKGLIKRSRTNEALVLLGLQIRGTTTAHEWVVTELGKRYGVERPYEKGGHKGYQTLWKETLRMYVEDNIGEIPTEFLTK